MAEGTAKGQAAAELALLLPLLILILLGCLDLGRAFSAWLTLQNGVREGARYGSMYPNDRTGIAAATRAEVAAGGLPAASVSVADSAPGGRGGGAPIVVTASYDFALVTSFLFGGHPLTMSATAQMAIVGGT